MDPLELQYGGLGPFRIAVWGSWDPFRIAVWGAWDLLELQCGGPGTL